MIKQQFMSPAIALYYWRERGMSIDKVLSHTGFTSLSELHNEHLHDLIAEEWARDDMLMTPEERQREEDVEAIWSEFGNYMKEFVPPDEYADEIERLLPLVQMTRQVKDAARSQAFRESVRRRLN